MPHALTSQEVFARLASLPYTVFLDSSDAGDAGSSKRYSIIATEPLERVDSWEELHVRPVCRSVAGALPFSGGWMGYLAYEAYDRFIPQVPARETHYPKLSFGFYDTFLCFDHGAGRAWVASLGLGDPDGDSDEQLARKKIEDLKQRIEKGSVGAGLRARPARPDNGHPRGGIPTEPRPSVTLETYRHHINTIHEYLRAGDCYQVNYTQCFEGKSALPPDVLYQRLRRVSPAPYAAYLNWDSFQILSASPESFLEIDKGRLRTCPIKGTRPRASSPHDDARMRQELLESAKDRAELLMITDLERNDLGKVCDPGSVETVRLIDVQKLAQVYHLYSVIEGRLRDDVSPWDVLKACFPGGSITGAPKIRAMQIIHELETHAREVYTGAIGYVGIDGRCRFNIPIRTMIHDQGHVKLYAGGGIVAESDPDAEYEECLVKAKGMREALML